jgi:hypothetical protein
MAFSEQPINLQANDISFSCNLWRTDSPFLPSPHEWYADGECLANYQFPNECSDIYHGSIMTFITYGMKNASGILIDINKKKDLYSIPSNQVISSGDYL